MDLGLCLTMCLNWYDIPDKAPRPWCPLRGVEFRGLRQGESGDRFLGIMSVIPDKSFQRLWPTKIFSLNVFATYCWMSLNAHASAVISNRAKYKPFRGGGKHTGIEKLLSYAGRLCSIIGDLVYLFSRGFGENKQVESPLSSA